MDSSIFFALKNHKNNMKAEQNNNNDNKNKKLLLKSHITIADLGFPSRESWQATSTNRLRQV